MKAIHPQESSASMRLLAKAWFSVTPNERLAILVVLGLFLLGLGTRAWYLNRESETLRRPAPMTGSAMP